MPEATGRVKELDRRAVDQNGEARAFHTIHYPVHQFATKAKLLKCLPHKPPAHAVVRTLHIKLDRHQTPMNKGSLKNVHKLLGKQDVISNIVATEKCPALG